MKERKQFIDAYMAQEASLSAQCRQFGISRKTGYKWIGRFLGGCELGDRSRRPKHSPRAVAAALEDAIVAARRERPTWGPEKLRTTLLKANPGVEIPSVTTFALIFQRNGLVIPRRRRRRVPRGTTPLAHADAPNAVWCIDFKGDFVVGRGRCHPLTVTDAYSRYLLACVALRTTRTTGVGRALEQVFRAFGLPRAIRSDNGAPFASVHGPATHVLERTHRYGSVRRDVGAPTVACGEVLEAAGAPKVVVAIFTLLAVVGSSYSGVRSTKRRWEWRLHCRREPRVWSPAHSRRCSPAGERECPRQRRRRDERDERAPLGDRRMPVGGRRCAVRDGSGGPADAPSTGRVSHTLPRSDPRAWPAWGSYRDTTIPVPPLRA